MTLEQARAELGVTSRTNAAGIRRAFKKLALQHHPDRNPDRPEAAAKFRRVLLAYEILSGQRAPSLGASAGPSQAGSHSGPTTSRRSAASPIWPPFEEMPRPVATPDGTPLHYPTPEEIAQLDSEDRFRGDRFAKRGLLALALFVTVLWALEALSENGPGPLSPAKQQHIRDLGRRW